MNLKKAKLLRKISKFVFTEEKNNGNENLKNIEIDSRVWMENTTRKVFTTEQDYALVQAFSDDGTALHNEDGTPKLVPSPKIDDNGTPVMRKVEWAPGTISNHPYSTRGIYRNLKKNTKNVPIFQIKQQLAYLKVQQQLKRIKQPEQIVETKTETP